MTLLKKGVNAYEIAREYHAYIWLIVKAADAKGITIFKNKGDILKVFEEDFLTYTDIGIKTQLHPRELNKQLKKLVEEGKLVKTHNVYHKPRDNPVRELKKKEIQQSLDGKRKNLKVTDWAIQMTEKLSKRL